MKKKINFILINSLLLFLNSCFVHKKESMKYLEIAGIVVDSKTLLPINNALIYDINNNLIDSTNDHGYFITKIPYSNNGEIFFSFKISASNYNSLIQKEHWGYQQNMKGVYYIGLKHISSKNTSFSKLINSKTEYSSIINYIENNDELKLDNQIQFIKQNNEKIFFEINSIPYLINNTGWIKLKSINDTIIINNSKDILAKDINLLYKRSQIKYMTPSKYGNKIEIFLK